MNHQLTRSVEEFVGVTQAPALTLFASERAEIKAAHLQWPDAMSELPTRCERADGYVVYFLRRELPTHPYWVDERHTPIDTLSRGQFLLLDLRAQHEALVAGDVDCISVYAASDALQRFQEEHELPASGLLRAPSGEIHSDSIIGHLSEALLPAIHEPQYANHLYVSHVTLALLSRLTAQFGIEASQPKLVEGGLASWQVRRATEMLAANLDGGIGLDELATECRLSRSHFARAFKVSTGTSPLRWLAAQRTERTKSMLLNSDQSLSQIASACGFSDASHLTRVFSNAVGLSPGKWRRLRRF